MDSMAMTTMAAAVSTTAAAVSMAGDDGPADELERRRHGQDQDQSHRQTRRHIHNRSNSRYISNLYRSLIVSALVVITTIGYHHVHLIRNLISHSEQREIHDYHGHHQEQQQQQQQLSRGVRRMKNGEGIVVSSTKETDKKGQKSVPPDLSDGRLLHNTTTTTTATATATVTVTTTTTTAATDKDTDLETIDVPDFVRPTNGNTLVALVAMGKSAESFIVHRCIRSLRTSGEFDGHVIVLTDPEGFQHLNSTMGWDPSTQVVRGRDEDMVPRWNNGTTIKYRQVTMIYKRYKTLLGKYVSADPQLDRVIEYMMYIDVDNIVTRPFRSLLDDYYHQLPTQWLNASRDLRMGMSTKAAAAATTSAFPQFSFWSFWKDPSNKKRWQGGQTLHHRKYSEQCSIAWRHEMDTNPEEIFDQPLLLRALKKSRPQFHQQQQSESHSSNKRTPCVVFSLPDPKIHFGYATSDILIQKQQSYENTSLTTTNSDQDDNNQNLNTTTTTRISSILRRRASQTLVHITSARTRKFNGHDQVDFIRRAMHLSNDTFATLEGNETFMVPGVVLWRDVAVPIGANNEHPPGFKFNKKTKTQKKKKMVQPYKHTEQQKNDLVQRYIQSKQQQQQQTSKHRSSSKLVLPSPPPEPIYERKTSSRK